MGISARAQICPVTGKENSLHEEKTYHSCDLLKCHEDAGKWCGWLCYSISALWHLEKGKWLYS